MKEVIYIGIDPGAGGGMAVFYPDGKKTATSYKNEGGYSDALRELAATAEFNDQKIFVCVEYLTGVSGGFKITGRQGFVMGTSYGKIGGALEALQIPHDYVAPQIWQKGLNGLGKSNGKDRKKLLHQICRQRFPELAPTLATCDAILIAEYAAKHGGVR